MRELERRYPAELVVIGVHSGKYHAERVTGRIRDASLRLGATHPVVNDRQFRIWRSYAVAAWPTLVVIDPAGKVVGSHAGEFAADMLVPFIDGLIAAAQASDTLDVRPIHFEPDQPGIAPGLLRYPGKVSVDGNRIAISDSGNHRVLIGSLSDDRMRMTVTRTVGGAEPGFADGLAPLFNSPQGLLFSGDTLYVADSGNHSVRTIDVGTGRTATLVGTGRQLRSESDREAGSLSSPWDLTLVEGILFIAMAGAHQLWSFEVNTRTLRVHSGSGGEDIRDGGHRDALLAQPMGIVPAGNRLYFADSESSAIRWADTAVDGAIHTLVGTGLFDFGNADGTGDEVLMQHQQGVALHTSGRLLIADSYNDSIKWLDPATRLATTWVRGLHEPGGVACAGRVACVADTNAHRIATINYETGALGDLAVA
ncbi:MAG: alkyl hydroperoxide reductase [Gemmatimonadaceae bacterium]